VLGVEEDRDVRDVGAGVELPDDFGVEAVKALQDQG